MTKEKTVLTGEGNTGDRDVELHPVDCQPAPIDKKKIHTFKLKYDAQN